MLPFLYKKTFRQTVIIFKFLQEQNNCIKKTPLPNRESASCFTELRMIWALTRRRCTTTSGTFVDQLVILAFTVRNHINRFHRRATGIARKRRNRRRCSCTFVLCQLPGREVEEVMDYRTFCCASAEPSAKPTAALLLNLKVAKDCEMDVPGWNIDFGASFPPLLQREIPTRFLH